MIGKLLKLIILAAVILMVGQIPLKNSTVGAVFVTQIKRSIDLGRGAAEHTTLFSSLGRGNWMQKLKNFFAVKAQPITSPPGKAEPLEMDDEGEDFTPGDREAILKVLE